MRVSNIIKHNNDEFDKTWDQVQCEIRCKLTEKGIGY